MKTIKLLNGEEFEVKDILSKMDDDSFYYGYLGKNALSSSMCKSLIESPEAYVRELNKPAKGKRTTTIQRWKVDTLISFRTT